MNAFFQKCLVTLDFPQISGLNLENRNDIITLVTWLEDRKIRELNIGDREPLRSDSGNWDASFNSYLQSLGCPYEWQVDSNMDCLSWLVSHAMIVEYEEVASSCANLEENEAGNSSTSMIVEGDDAETNNLAASASIDELGALLKTSRLNQENDVGAYFQYVNYQLQYGFLSTSH